MLDEELPLAIAHRGSGYLWPENTMLAFEGAVGLGYRWLETDLHITSDGVLVCLHDDTLDRTTDGHGPVWERTIEDVQRLDAGAHHVLEGDRPYVGSGARVPSLEEALTTFPDVRFVVDMKQDGLEQPLADLLESLRAWERVIVGSFSDRRLRRLRAIAGDRVATSAGPLRTRAAVAGAWARLPIPAANALQIPPAYKSIRLITERLVRAYHAAGMQVHAWTIDEPDEMRRLLDLGVDGIISDRPDLLAKVFAERGLAL